MNYKDIKNVYWLFFFKGHLSAQVPTTNSIVCIENLLCFLSSVRKFASNRCPPFLFE